MEPVDSIPNPLHVHDALAEPVGSPAVPLYIQFWKWEKVGLYCHYMGVGLVMSSVNLCNNFCYYTYGGSPSVCANSWSLIVLPWGLKVLYALVTDSFRPWGYRRWVYLCAGWVGVIFFSLLLAILAKSVTVTGWIGLSLVVQGFLMLADTVADGICIEVGQLESVEERGQVLATGQRVRFAMTIFGALIQCLLVNGNNSTNPPGCRLSPSHCWQWGLGPSQYYGLLTALLCVVAAPILFYKELDASSVPLLSFSEQRLRLWRTLSSPPILYLLVFVAGNNCFSAMNSITMMYVEFVTTGGISNLQTGVASLLSSFVTFLAIFVFQTKFRGSNWRCAQIANMLFCAVTGLLWILVYFNFGHMLSGWTSVILDANWSVGAAFTQVLVGMAVIELAKKGLESTAFELIISVANAGTIINNYLATELLAALRITTCDEINKTDNGLGNFQCRRAGGVNIATKAAFLATDGPWLFTKYSLVMFAINVLGIFVFTRFLAKNKKECTDWKNKSFGGCEEGETFVTIVESLPRAMRAMSLQVSETARSSLSLVGFVGRDSTVGASTRSSVIVGAQTASSRESRAFSAAGEVELGRGRGTTGIGVGGIRSLSTESTASTVIASHSSKPTRQSRRVSTVGLESELAPSPTLRVIDYFSPKELLGILVADRDRVGRVSVFITVSIIFYQLFATVALLNKSWACHRALGGAGCGR